MRKIRLLLILFFLAGFTGTANSFPWSKDMVDQPSIKPYEKPMTPPLNTLHQEQSRRPMTREEMEKRVKNPVSPTPKSIKNGKRLYMIHCSLCHGTAGRGDGIVSKKFVQPPDISIDFYKKDPDGHIYGTIRNGGAVMPDYGENIPEKEIWDVVNFIRVLQGK